jgi:hypothetical protein
MFNCTPNDPKILEMDEITKSWMFFSWIEDKSEKTNLLKNLGCLIGSFWNPKGAKELLGIKDENTASVSNDDFEKAVDFVKNSKKQTSKKRKRKKVSFKE